MPGGYRTARRETAGPPARPRYAGRPAQPPAIGSEQHAAPPGGRSAQPVRCSLRGDAGAMAGQDGRRRPRLGALRGQCVRRMDAGGRFHRRVALVSQSDRRGRHSGRAPGDGVCRHPALPVWHRTNGRGACLVRRRVGTGRGELGGDGRPIPRRLHSRRRQGRQDRRHAGAAARAPRRPADRRDKPRQAYAALERGPAGSDRDRCHPERPARHRHHPRSGAGRSQHGVGLDQRARARNPRLAGGRCR